MAFLLVCAPCGEIQEKFLDKSTISTGLPKCLAFYAKTSDSKTLKIQEFFLGRPCKSVDVFLDFEDGLLPVVEIQEKFLAVSYLYLDMITCAQTVLQ